MFGYFGMLLIFLTYLFADVSDLGILQEAVKKFEWDVDVESITSGQNPTGKELLLSNTQEAVERGSFGVPR